MPKRSESKEVSSPTTGRSPRSTSCASPRRQSGTSLRRPAVHKFEKNGTDNGTWNAKASSGGAASEQPPIGRLLRMREKPIRAFEDFRAKSVGGRSIRKRLARSSSIASAAIIASIPVAKAAINSRDRQALSRSQREHPPSRTGNRITPHNHKNSGKSPAALSVAAIFQTNLTKRSSFVQ